MRCIDNVEMWINQGQRWPCMHEKRDTQHELVQGGIILVIRIPSRQAMCVSLNYTYLSTEDCRINLGTLL